MNVKQLIRELKQYPGHYDVGIALHDNREGEMAGCVFSTEEFDNDGERDNDCERTEGNWVIIRC